MALKTANANGEWATCGWTGGDNAVPTTGDTADLNGKALTLTDAVATCDQIQASGATGSLTISGTSTINANIAYAGTATSGMVIIPTGANLAHNGVVSESSSGYAIEMTGTGTYTNSNAGNTIINSTGSGRAINVIGASTLNLVGNAIISSGFGVRNSDATAIINFNGNVTLTSSVTSPGSACGIYNAYGTLNFTGLPITTYGGAPAIYAVLGTINWTGAATIPAGTNCFVVIRAGTLDLNGLVCANSGTLVIGFAYNDTTLTQGTGTITNQTATAQFAGIGVNSVAFVGPTLPAAAKVDTTQGDFGYAGSPVTPTLDLSTYTLNSTITSTLNTNKAEMIAANDSIRAAFSCDAGTASTIFVLEDD